MTTRRTNIHKCPKCGLINPSEALRCDCGWDFVLNRQERSYLTTKQLSNTTKVGLGVGGIVIILLLLRFGVAFVMMLSK